LELAALLDITTAGSSVDAFLQPEYVSFGFAPIDLSPSLSIRD
jgi:hypothetical protein